MGKSKISDGLLCTDVLLELFQYFYVDEIFHLFNEMIYHLPSLLRNGKVQLHIRHIDKSFRKHILPNIEIEHVLSIRIRNLYQMAPVGLGQFSQVRSLILHNVTTENWPCEFPTKLKHLTVHVRSKHREQVFLNAVSLDNLQRLEFHSTFLQFYECPMIFEKPSTIKHLIFRSQRCSIDYQFLLNNMPCLRSIDSINTWYPQRFHEISGRFSSLNTIHLVCRHIDIEAMIYFLIKIAPNSLRRCSLINIANSLSPRIANLLIFRLFSDFLSLS